MTLLIDAPTRATPRTRGDRLLLLIPPAATLAVCLIGIDSASLWRDEAATLDAEARPFPGLLHMLIHVDAVHGLYYLLLWPVVHTFGGGEFAVRFPSALAMAAAAYGIGKLGSLLHSRRAGIAAGLVFAALPQVSRYGQEARPYALVIAVAVLATYLLLRALANPRRGNWIAYACAVSLLGLLNLFALLLLLAHATFARRQGRIWLATVAFACTPAVPILALAATQQDQLSWVTKPGTNAGGDLAIWLAGSVLSVALASVLIGLFLGRKPGHALSRLAIPWLMLPPIVLILGSELKPVYVPRYLAFCLPALALLIGAGLATITIGPRVIGVLLLALLGMPTQSAIRQVAGHGDDIRDAVTILDQQARPGDGVLFNCPPCHYPDMPREFTFAYPQAFAGLTDVTMATAPSASNTLRGTTDLGHPTLNVDRVWVLDVDGSAEPAALHGSGFRLITVQRAGNIAIEDYERE